MWFAAFKLQNYIYIYKEIKVLFCWTYSEKQKLQRGKHSFFSRLGRAVVGQCQSSRRLFEMWRGVSFLFLFSKNVLFHRVLFILQIHLVMGLGKESFKIFFRRREKRVWTKVRINKNWYLIVDWKSCCFRAFKLGVKEKNLEQSMWANKESYIYDNNIILNNEYFYLILRVSKSLLLYSNPNLLFAFLAFRLFHFSTSYDYQLKKSSLCLGDAAS